MSFLDKFKTKKVTGEQNPKTEEKPQELKREKTIPPHIVACKVCEGTGKKDGKVCPQCKGSGRVIVSCEVTTFVTAYEPET